MERFARLTPEQECERILQTVGDHPENVQPIFTALGLQFRLLHNRGQVLLGLCGVLISTSVVLMTGKIIGRQALAHPELMALLFSAAGITEIAAAAVVIGGVLRLRWMTELPGEDLRSWVLTCLLYRDSKTSAFRVAIALLLVSMACFATAATLAWLQLS